MSNDNQYADRDAMWLDQQGGHYIRHVDHMTREGLHSKSDIAAELGWRDLQIQELTQQLSAKTISEQNIINAFGISGEGAHSKLVIEYVHGLVALAEERREFIVNGVEHDYIELPLFEDDRANAIYQRCLLKDGYAAAEITAELRAQGVDEFAASIGAEAAGLSMSSNAYKAIKSTVFRAVNFAANLRAGRKG